MDRGVRGLTRDQLCRVIYDQLTTSCDLEEGLKSTFKDVTGKAFDDPAAFVTAQHVHTIMKKIGELNVVFIVEL